MIALTKVVSTENVNTANKRHFEARGPFANEANANDKTSSCLRTISSLYSKTLIQAKLLSLATCFIFKVPFRATAECLDAFVQQCLHVSFCMTLELKDSYSVGLSVKTAHAVPGFHCYLEKRL